MYIWQQSSWPQFVYDHQALAPLLSDIRLLQGRLIGHADYLDRGASLANQMDALVQEAIQTSAIEGEVLNAASVRSSAARRLGLDTSGLVPGTPETEQLVQMLTEAVSAVDEQLDANTLFRWQANLFTERPLFMPKEAIIGGLRQDMPFILWRLRVIVFLESWTFFYTGLITHHRHWMDSCGLVWHTCGWSHCIRFRMAMVVLHERLRIERLHRMKKPAFASTA
jgi:hypothetical protein